MRWFDPAFAAGNSPTTVDHTPACNRAIEIVLVRHAEIEEKYHERYIGSSDVPLGEKGIEQAATLATVAEPRMPGKVFASPMLQVQQTVEIVLPGEACVWLDDLREIDFGAWENRTFAEVAETEPVSAARWAKLEGDFAFPGGESLESFQRRVARAANTILEQAYADDSCQRVFIYSHGVVIRSLIGHWLGLPLRAQFSLEVSSASISTLRLQGDRGVLTRLNDTTHVQQMEPRVFSGMVSL